MKLFVWHDVLKDYTSGVMVALAEDVAAAREALCPGWNKHFAWTKKEGDARRYGPDGEIVWWFTKERDLEAEPTVYDLDKPMHFEVAGGG